MTFNGLELYYPGKYLYTVNCILTALFITGFTFTGNFQKIAIVIVCISVTSSGGMVNTPLIYADCFPKSFASALGLSNIIGAVAALLLGPVMDKLKEFSGSYDMPLYLFFRLMLFFHIL